MFHVEHQFMILHCRNKRIGQVLKLDLCQSVLFGQRGVEMITIFELFVLILSHDY